MICPSCGSHVPDDATVCPACHAELALTSVLPRLKGTYCSACGALIPEGAVRCPSCGMPVAKHAAPLPSRNGVFPDSSSAEVDVDEDAPDLIDQDPTEDDGLDEESTNVLPRIESSIPAEEDVREGVFDHERMPHNRVFLLAAVASLIIVGGAILIIAHPWDPQFFSGEPTTAADTKEAGFPGTVEKLQGQDSSTTSSSSSDTAAATTTADPIFNSLSSAYDTLGDLSDKIDANEDTFDKQAITGDLSTRVAGKNDADSIGLEVSNLYTQIQQIDVSSTPYSEDADHLLTLASWLRNRTDSLSEAWALDVASGDPSSDEDKIRAPLDRYASSDGKSSFAALFTENYDSWKPVESTSES